MPAYYCFDLSIDNDTQAAIGDWLGFVSKSVSCEHLDLRHKRWTCDGVRAISCARDTSSSGAYEQRYWMRVEFEDQARAAAFRLAFSQYEV